jgi:hypothetical protein
MPGFDGTGPLGQGPLTGGGRGFCAIPIGYNPTVPYSISGIQVYPVSYPSVSGYGGSYIPPYRYFPYPFGLYGYPAVAAGFFRGRGRRSFFRGIGMRGRGRRF